MLQVAQSQLAETDARVVLAVEETTLSPAAMARYLRRTNGEAALCFAQAIYEDAAWANEAWGAYWADVVRMI